MQASSRQKNFNIKSRTFSTTKRIFYRIEKEILVNFHDLYFEFLPILDTNVQVIAESINSNNFHSTEYNLRRLFFPQRLEGRDQ